MQSVRLALGLVCLAGSVACGASTPAPAAPAATAPVVDPATAAAVTVTVNFEGTLPAPAMMRLDGDPKCVAENGARDRADESMLPGTGNALQNVFVYIKDGLSGQAFPIPTDAVVLDQDKCRYTPRVLGVRVGQPLTIRNGDPLLHNVRAEGKINQPFNMSTPIECSSIRTSAPPARTAAWRSTTCRRARIRSKPGTSSSA
jgi:hypothetical protein